MKKSIGHVLILLCFVGLVTNCKKKKDDPAPSDTPTVCNNNSGTKLSYMPNTSGSFWKYKGAMTYTTSVGCDTVINGKTYTANTNSKSKAVSYFLKSGDSYSYKTLSGSIKNLTFLKDASEGTTWVNSYPNLVYNYDYEYRMQIDSVNLTKMVNGVAYPNVIKVSQNIYIDINDGDGYDLYETDYYYYAYGIGLVLSDLEYYGEVYLDSYSIK